MQQYFQDIIRLSLGSTPEDMLKASLDACIKLTGASGGSILGEEGPSLQFLFSDNPSLIGIRVPFQSIAGTTVTKNLVVFTYAPKDKRHFAGVDSKTKKETKYLLSIPIPTVHSTSAGNRQAKSTGALQLLFEENVTTQDTSALPRELTIDEFTLSLEKAGHFAEVLSLLPIIAFGLEVVRLRQTSYQVIHELKNKLISGISWIDCLKEDIAGIDATILENATVKDDFELASASVREGAELSKSYLQFTKIYSPVFAMCDIRIVLREVAASAKALASDMGCADLEVKLNCPPEMHERELDRGQLKMAFFNLCKNGAEALITFKTPNPVLTLDCSENSGALEIRISDNGPGMPQEIADNLFMAFKTKKEGGTGLGLTITKKIIDVHGGSIRCETGATGTTFVIVI